MATPRAHTPSHDRYSPIPTPNEAHLSKGYGAPPTEATDFAPHSGNPIESSPLSQSLQQQQHHHHHLGNFHEDFDASQRGSSIVDGDIHRSASSASAHQGGSLSRNSTLKKKGSLSRKSSLKRSGSRKSLRAGSIKGVNIHDEGVDPPHHNSVFYTPIPTSGAPTDILANRFQAWRKLLKDLITYFREIQASYEHRAKALLKVSNVINNTNAPSIFLTEGGLNDAMRILRDYHKQSMAESNKAKDIENEVIVQLTSLRSDLGQKIKEIKSLSGDFKNSVEKEKEGTRKAVTALEEALAAVDSDPAAVTGKGDPYIVRLAVDRQVERQIDEENYLHRAYLNLEGSGRELESIVVGEIQKAYNALASILKRDADEAYNTVEKLRTGPIAIPRDLEWNSFVGNDPHFVNPKLPLRHLEDIEYPGKHHPAAAEVRAGMLERKSKYLKSYTPGWYVLSPTHLHEFKSADRIYTQPPVMSLYLPEQKLGSHSQPGSSSHKFMLKGRQTGAMHRGHSWVFRAESYDTMLAWYEDIKSLTEKSGEERNAFVRRHTRSVSAGSARSIASSDGGLEEDEADEVPYSAHASLKGQAAPEAPPQRPSPGGRFPSDIQTDRHLQAPLSPSSGSSEVDHDLTAASGGLQNAGSAHPGFPYHEQPTTYREPEHLYTANTASQRPSESPITTSPPAHHVTYTSDSAYRPPPTSAASHQHDQPQYLNNQTPVTQPGQAQPSYFPSQPERHSSSYGDWMAPAAGGAAVGVVGAEAYHHEQQKKQQQTQQQPETPREPVPTPAVQEPAISSGESSQPSTRSTAPTSYSIISQDIPTEELPVAPNDPTTKSFLGRSDEALPANGASSLTELSEDGPETSEVPAIMRQNTDISVSDLPVPGRYPRTPAPLR